MIENYTVVDLLANLYKKKIQNIIVFSVLFLMMAIPSTMKIVNQKPVEVTDTSYSSYLIFKINSEDFVQTVNNNVKIKSYNDFFTKLILANLNGPYLFNDTEAEKLETIAKALNTSQVALRNSNLDFWDKKITVNNLGAEVGVSIEVITQSKDLNSILEEKIDKLVESYKTAYTDLKVEKLSTVYSDSGNGTTVVAKGYSKVKLVIRILMFAVLSAMFVVFLNVIRYIFNPTINNRASLEKYGIDFIYDAQYLNSLPTVLDYKAKAVNYIRFNKQHFNEFVGKGHVVEANDLKQMLEYDNYIIVIEYGQTRYKEFESLLCNLKNINKNIVGVITYKL